MAGNISRLTSKYQATVPAAVRQSLGLKAGDALRFEITPDGVVLTKATDQDLEFAQSLTGTLSEWSSAADEDAYRDL
ncbi:MAG: type II toxin-antitoxin system PrlF family antitoxin [Gammaproteobacteria bacterium]|nr:type II toxin-antitoxin system PrlF family antitoxin [Gammaproteobacteria bacterium]